MNVENIKFYPLLIKVIAAVWLVAITINVNAQSADKFSASSTKQSPQQASKQATEQTKIAREVDTNYIEAFPEESTEESYKIYRKVNLDNPCDRGLDAYNYEKKWYDNSQIFINSKFCEPALWFDNFFGDDRLFKEGVAGTYVRWRNEFTYDEEEYFEYKMRLNFSVELPALQGRARLTFEGDEEQDLRDIAPGNGDETTNKLGLQLDIKETTRSKFNVNISLSPMVRFRYRYTYPMGKIAIVRFTQELQREIDVISARSQIDYERTLKEDFLFRSSTEGKASEEFDGIDWLQAFVLYQRVNKKTSLSYETSVSGITQPWTKAANYRVGVRFRKNFHREWLFYEIAPEVTWPVTLDQQRSMIDIERRSKWLLFFRLEAHFGNASKKRYQSYI